MKVRQVAGGAAVLLCLAKSSVLRTPKRLRSRFDHGGQNRCAVLIPVYGKEKIESERPFKAVLQNGACVANGALHGSDGKGGVTAQWVGGTAEVRASKADDRILRMAHYK